MTASIIIPLYNKGNHIRRAIKSVLGQTYPNFELIVVDDGSTDGSGKRVREVADHRVHLLKQKNAGASAARNRGLSEARAPLVSFLDADDEWMPDFLETVIRLHSKFPQAKVWGTGYALQDRVGGLTPVSSGIKGEACLINYWASAVVAQPIHASSMLIEREALQEIGGFRQTLVWLEDTEMLVRMALRYPIAYSPEIKTIYHMDAENRSDRYIYSGNVPFFEAAYSYLRECDNSVSLPKEVAYYLALMQTRAFLNNWIAGNRAAIREIISHCHNISGYRALCFWWWVASVVPHKLVVAAWCVRLFAGRCVGGRGRLKPVRSIYR